MGVIVKYTCCHCGFVADEIFLGPGWVICLEAVLCLECGNITSAQIDEMSMTIKPGTSRCSACHSDRLVPWDHKCPKCGSPDLDEESVGMWD